MLSCKTIVFLFPSLLASQALPIRREVPQEHSHQATLAAVTKLLQLNNPDKIVDPVFGLLGNAAASQGLGKITDPDCLQQATADQAFTNAKAAADVVGQTNALIYRALERNTGKVGLASNACKSIKAKNPEIAAIQQHQDPASSGAAALNKGITLELAKQIASIGGDPIQAKFSGTFAPGNLNDNTGKGNTCDDANDPIGCIISQKLIVFDASDAEITAAVAGISAGGSGSNAATVTDTQAAATGTTSSSNDNSAQCPPAVTVTVTPSAATATATQAAAAATSASNNSSSNNAAAASGNLQKFTGALGGKTAPAVGKGGKGFQVDGSDSFINLNAALGRSCDIQHNACANFANSAAGRSANISVGNCDQQNNQCHAAIQ